MDGDVASPVDGDAFGMALLAMITGSAKAVVIERDDGWIDVDAADYLSRVSEQDEWALARAHGKVLDIGVGAGRNSLMLQDRGHEVTALDVSAGAIEACRLRGVKSVYLGSVQEAAAGAPAGWQLTDLLAGNVYAAMLKRSPN